MTKSEFWQPAKPIDVFFFDCDSTLSTIEGLDELAVINGVGAEVKQITERCMELTGLNVEVYNQRLELVRPTKEQMIHLSNLYIQNISPGAQETIRILQRLGKDVHILSGGIKQSIVPLALHLGVSESRLHAVELFFDRQGGYLGFDESSHLVQSKGKNKKIASLLQSHQQGLLMGDGFSDWEAHTAVSRFIGYGGVQARNSVRDNSNFFIEAASFFPLLNLALTQEEIGQLESDEFRLYEEGARLIELGWVLIRE